MQLLDRDLLLEWLLSNHPSQSASVPRFWTHDREASFIILVPTDLNSWGGESSCLWEFLYFREIFLSLPTPHAPGPGTEHQAQYCFLGVTWQVESFIRDRFTLKERSFWSGSLGILKYGKTKSEHGNSMVCDVYRLYFLFRFPGKIKTICGPHFSQVDPLSGLNFIFLG